MDSFPIKTPACITCNVSPTNEFNVTKLPYLTTLNAARSPFRCVIFSIPQSLHLSIKYMGIHLNVSFSRISLYATWIIRHKDWEPYVCIYINL